jgi:hypothetical protein
MSSESDKVVFDAAVDRGDNVNLFQNKKWTYITDSSSANGQFNGQLQWDLNTLSSQNQWTDLSQAVITFPVKLSIANVNNLTPTVGINAATIKNGFHQFVDSVQVVLGGSTVQSSQIFTNIDVNYKILTEWSRDTLEKYGSTLGLGLDELEVSFDSNTGISESIDNIVANDIAPAGRGIDLWTPRNSGIKARLRSLNNTNDVSALGKAILGSNQSLLGKSNCQAGANSTVDADQFVLYALGTVRLKDLSPAIAALPLMKSLKGYVYLNYNASVHTITGSNTTTSAVSSQSLYGRCAPAMFNVGLDGIAFNATSSALRLRSEISAVASTSLTTAQPIQTNAMLYAPYYVATPDVDRSLTMKKTIRYTERFVSQFNVAANGSFTGTLTPGISNPKRLILYPYLTGAGTSGFSTFQTNPLLSPFDGCPSTTSPFAAIKDWQVYVGNSPVFQQPQTQDWMAFCNEVAQQGEQGGLVDTTSSGLLSQELWNTLYRYYTCDIGRRMNSEDGASKSVQVSLTNATNCPMTIVAIIHYEREITVDTATGVVLQSM